MDYKIDFSLFSEFVLSMNLKQMNVFVLIVRYLKRNLTVVNLLAERMIFLFLILSLHKIYGSFLHKIVNTLKFILNTLKF